MQMSMYAEQIFIWMISPEDSFNFDTDAKHNSEMVDRQSSGHWERECHLNVAEI